MKTTPKISLVFILTIFFLTSCEKQEYFKSESGIKKQLAHSWRHEPLARTDSPNEIWTFNGENLTITGMAGVPFTLEGHFSVRTTLMKVFIRTKDFDVQGREAEAGFLNGAKWTVVKLDDEILTMAADDPRGGGLVEREFTRQ